MYLYSSFAIYEQNQNFDVINGTVEDPGDLYFAFYVDDVISSTMPSKDSGYTLDTEKSSCTNGATPLLNEDTWSIKVSNLTTTHTKCTLYFTVKPFSETLANCGTINNAAQCFLDNAKQNQTELVLDSTADNNLRYIGANPNNYVRFNDELWRIIGVFNNIDNGTGTLESRLKIIRDEPYNTSANWHVSSSNDWTSLSALRIEFNGTFLSSISSSYRNMMGNAVWHLGGAVTYNSSGNGLARHWYTYERGTRVYSGNKTEWTGQIALMYPSDYGFATSGGSTRSRVECLSKELYNWNDTEYADCYTNDWLYNSKNAEWTLTSYSGSQTYIFTVMTSGKIDTSVVSSFLAATPTLYLSSQVRITSGSGTSSDPYILSL